MSDRTELQEAIIEQHKKDPSQSDEEIAVEADASASYVNDVRNQYEEGEESGGKSGAGKVVAFIVLLLALLALATGEGEAATTTLRTLSPAMILFIPRTEGLFES